MASKLLTNLCFCSLTAYFRKVDMYHYQGLARGQLIQQETLTQLATLVYACNLLVLPRASADAQMMQNILTETDHSANFIE